MTRKTLCFGFAIVAGVCLSPGTASTQAHDPAPHIAQIHTKPAGQSYGRWAAEWWQWALGYRAL